MNLNPILTAPMAPPAERAGPHVVVIGGGASGVLMAAHLLRDGQAPAQVTIIEDRHMLGCGIAYSTDDPDHLLNTRASSMSAFPDQPGHFRDWLARQGIAAGPQPGDSFVSRSTYGAYVASLIEPWSRGEGSRRLRCLRDTCVGLAEDEGGVTAHLSDGRSIRADMAVLATGHAVPEPDPDGLVQGSWEPQPMPERDDRVVIVGSGLSMVDRVLSLLRRGHRGEILVVSRRAQLPRVHAVTRPLKVAVEDIPLGAPVSRLMGWLRGLAAGAEAAGGSWRDAWTGCVRISARSGRRCLGPNAPASCAMPPLGGRFTAIACPPKAPPRSARQSGRAGCAFWPPPSRGPSAMPTDSCWP